MNCREKIWNFIQNKDRFGKEAQLYYNGEEKFTTKIGIIITILYFVIYMAYFIYKLNRMLTKEDFSFYDTFEYNKEPPSIELSADKFYVGFALENPKTYDSFIDETIYYPKAYYRAAVRNGGNWDWEKKELELERCNITKFGKDFTTVFTTNGINNLYCFKDINQKLIGHFSYDNYSFIYIQLFPCKNTTENNNHCKPREEIDFYLDRTFFSMEFEDIELTPENYSHPVRPRNQDVYFTVGKKLFQEVHIYFQIIKVKTDEEIIGIDEFKDYITSDKEDIYLKYHSTYQMPNLIEDDIYLNDEPFADITIKLYDQIRIQKRSYSKLLEIWGDVGGAMEVISSILAFFVSFPVDILFEQSIVNNLFKFDKRQKLIKIRRLNRKLDNLEKSKTLEEKENKHIIITNENINSLAGNNIVITKGNINRINGNNNDDIISSLRFIQQYIKKTYQRTKTTYNNFMIKKEQNEDKEIKINLGYIYFCFCCARKRKNYQNLMLDEGMKMVIDEIDLFTMFKKLYNINNRILNNEKCISMPKYLRVNLEELNT